jgi:hypothetical protein
MYRAVTTRFAGPTDASGARVIVRSVKGTKTYPWQHELDTYANHESAARAAARSQDINLWTSNDYVPSASLPDGSGYVFLFAV